MNRKRWVLVTLILLVLISFSFYKLFYKTYDLRTVAKSADCIIAIDTKRITNTVIWDFITSPNLWKNFSFQFHKKKQVTWTDMIQIPDYVFIFHSKNQPLKTWFTVLSKSNKTDFEKGLLIYHFEKIPTKQNLSFYFSKDLQISFIENDDKLLIGNSNVDNISLMESVYNELFSSKQYINENILQKNIEQKSHLSLQLLDNSILKNTYFKANFDKTTITIEAVADTKPSFTFAENNFSYASNSLCTLAFTQPPKILMDLFSDSLKTKISTILNVDMDSILLSDNKFYKIDLSEIKERKDSAISFSYDSNFNPLQHIVENIVQEPAFNFSIKGNRVAYIFNYFESNNKIEKTAIGNLFVPMPLVKSYCSLSDSSTLNIRSKDFQISNPDKNIESVFFLNLVLSKIPENLLKFFPKYFLKEISNIESMRVVVTNKNNQLNLRSVFFKKQHDLPIFNFDQ